MIKTTKNINKKYDNNKTNGYMLCRKIYNLITALKERKKYLAYFV